MFGFGKRAKSKAEAFKATHEIIRSTLIRSVPAPSFWQEPYVMGVVYGTATTVATLASGNGLPKQDLGEIVLDVMMDVSGQDKMMLARRMGFLVQTKVPDFVLAAQRASKLGVMYNNRTVVGDEPEIMLARARALANVDLHRSLGIPNDGVSGVLVELHGMWISDPLQAAVRANGPD